MQPNTLRLDVWSPKNLTTDQTNAEEGYRRGRATEHTDGEKGNERSNDKGKHKPHLAVTLSTAVAEVGVALCAGHVVAPLGSLNVDLETQRLR